MSLRLCKLCIVNKHLYAFYIYMHDLSRADGQKFAHQFVSHTIGVRQEALPALLVKFLTMSH
jgi:hypothetical protein